MYGIVVLFVVLTVQSYDKMKFLPREKNYLEIITNFASPNRKICLTQVIKQPKSR